MWKIEEKHNSPFHAKLFEVAGTSQRRILKLFANCLRIVSSLRKLDLCLSFVRLVEYRLNVFPSGTTMIEARAILTSNQ